jgi:hypothetical protein
MGQREKVTNDAVPLIRPSLCTCPGFHSSRLERCCASPFEENLLLLSAVGSLVSAQRDPRQSSAQRLSSFDPDADCHHRNKPPTKICTHEPQLFVRRLLFVVVDVDSPSAMVPQIRARKIKAKVQQKRGARAPPPVRGGRSGGAGRGGGASPQQGTGRPGPRSLSYQSVKGGQLLVVGDGDFSFAKGLVKHLGGDGDGLVLTSYDSLKAVAYKYSNAKGNIDACQKAGAEVMHGVDATKLKQAFPSRKFDRIIFNFPHSGEQRVHVNRALLHDFFDR